MELHQAFLDEMKKMLGDEYPDFYKALTEDDAVRGARVNLVKMPSGELPTVEGFAAEPISYVDNGYILSGDGQIGRSPAHHAGIIYMQDPGAMSALAALDIEGDMWVADLCSAPGGKSSQAYERLGEGGFLLSNEYVPKRAKTIVSNFERLGIGRAIVTSLDTKELASMYDGAFDLVIVDAPCSGEGMLRKSEEAREQWTPEAPEICSQRQLEILRNAYKILAPGGRLLYSTCTWSIKENEGVVLSLLDEFPDLGIIPVRDRLKCATSDGIPLSGRDELRETRRCYPHKMRGEGQYVALLEKAENEHNSTTILYKDASKPLKKEDSAIIEAFFRDALTERPTGNLRMVGENIVLIPHSCPIPQRSVFMAGVLVGEIRRGVLFPSHHFFSAYGHLFKLKEDLSDGDVRLEKYLSGEEIESSLDSSGWCAVCYLGSTIGGGKISGGRVKNHYPKGLRNK